MSRESAVGHARHLVGGSRAHLGQRAASFPIWWVGDSINNMFELHDAVNTSLETLGATYNNSLLSLRATYGGSNIGNACQEFADTNYIYDSGAWVSVARGVPFSAIRLAVICSGRNDPGYGLTTTEYRQAYDKVIHQARRYMEGKVILCSPPPLANEALSAWATDNFVTSGFQAVLDALVTKWGAPLSDTHRDFTALVLAGTYTRAQLMRDTVHPTYTTGATTIASSVSTKAPQFVSVSNSASPELSGSIVNYFRGNPSVGAWSLGTITNVVGPYQSPIPRLTGYADQAYSISASGAKLTFPTFTATGGQVWVNYLTKNGGGNFLAYVDRGTANEVSLNINCFNDYQNYPKNWMITSNLGPGTHTVEIETTNAFPVGIVGITVVGAT